MTYKEKMCSRKVVGLQHQISLSITYLENPEEGDIIDHHWAMEMLFERIEGICLGYTV